MKRALSRLSLLSALILTALPAFAERVWSVEVITGETAPEQLLPDLAKRWSVRIEQRDDGKSLLVGAWQSQADAQQALVDIKKRFPLSFVRSAELTTDPRARRIVPMQGGIISFRESSRGLAEPRETPGTATRVQRDPDPWSSRLKRAPTSAPASAVGTAGQDATPARKQAQENAAPQSASGQSAAPAPSRSATVPKVTAPASAERLPKSKAAVAASAVPTGGAHETAIRQALAQGDSAAALVALRRAAQDGSVVAPGLLDEVLLADVRSRFGVALQQGAGATVARLVDDHPDLTRCSDPASAWAAAELIRDGGSVPQASAVMARMLDCADANIRLSTLEKSFDWQNPAVWRQWLAREQARSVAQESAVLPKRLDDLVYRDQVRQVVGMASGRDGEPAGAALSAPAATGSAADRSLLLTELGARVESRKDAGVAALLGWVHLRGVSSQPALDHAQRWFTRAQEWSPGLEDAQEGLIRVALLQGRAAEAWQGAQNFRGDAVKGRRLAQEAALKLGAAAYAQQAFDEALQWLMRAESLDALPQYATRQIAWAELAVGKAEQAAQRFAQSYRTKPDEESARGVVASYKSLGRLNEAKALPASAPLERLLAQEAGDQALGAKLFQAAARLQSGWAMEPDSLADAARAAQSTSLHAAPYSRRKSGSEGGSQLTVSDADGFGVALPVLKLSAWLEARLNRFSLDDGRPAASELAARARMEQANLLLRGETQQRWWEAEVGRLAQRNAGASLPAHTHARFAIGWESPDTSLTLTMSREPVRESLLSWSGILDAGVPRGAVIRDRLAIETRRNVGHRWTVGAQWRQDSLSGTAVADNRQQQLALQAGFDLALSGLDYAVVGLAASSLKSARNLSFFTPGHGGYFSPERQWRVGPTLDFMTREADTWIMKGRLAWGRTGKREAEAPVLPLAADGRVYPAIRERAAAWEAELGLVRQLLPHVQVGLWASRRHASEYDDRAYLLTIRLLDQPRNKVLSRDLPHFQASNWL